MTFRSACEYTFGLVTTGHGDYSDQVGLVVCCNVSVPIYNQSRMECLVCRRAIVKGIDGEWHIWPRESDMAWVIKLGAIINPKPRPGRPPIKPKTLWRAYLRKHKMRSKMRRVGISGGEDPSGWRRNPLAEKWGEMK